MQDQARRGVVRAWAVLSVLALAAAAGAWAPAASEKPAATPPEPAAGAGRATSPHEWAGHWKGPMTVSSPGASSPDGLRMELIVGDKEVGGRREWTIVYDGPVAGMRQERRYTLVDVDSAKGRYAIDENNGIVLRATLLDGVLYSPFAVGGTFCAASYRVLDAGTPAERLEFTLVSMPLDKPGTTGGDKAPTVQTWAVESVQRAELRRR
jgi:hypothetical protein